MHRYALRDDQWLKIKDVLPGREGHVGGTAADNRLFVDAVIYRYRTGIPWRDLPDALIADKGYDSNALVECERADRSIQHEEDPVTADAGPGSI